jgi:hypothetical protein
MTGLLEGSVVISPTVVQFRFQLRQNTLFSVEDMQEAFGPELIEQQKRRRAEIAAHQGTGAA